MHKWLKITLITAALTLGVFAAAVLSLTLLVNPNQFKQQLSAVFTEKTGRPLTITGPIAWSFFPWAGFVLQGVTLGNPPEFAHTPLATVAEIDVSLRVLPLLSGRLDIGALTLKKPNITLISTSGKNNWQDLLPANSQPPATAAQLNIPAKAQPSKQVPKKTLALHVHRVAIDQGQLNVQQPGQSFTLQDVRLRGSHVSLTEPFTLCINARFSQKNLHQPFTVSTRTSYLAGKKQLLLDNMQWDMPLRFNGPAKAVDLHLQGNATYDTQRKTLAIADLTALLGSMRAQGALQVHEKEGKPYYQGHLHLLPFSPTTLLSELHYPLALQDADVLTDASADFTLSGQGQTVRIPLKAKLDHSHLQGVLNLTLGTPRAFYYQLSLDQLNLDRYRPQSNSPPPTTARANTLIPLGKIDSTLSQILGPEAKLDGRFNINHLQFLGLTARQVRLDAHSQTDRLIFPLQAQLYHGHLQGELVLPYRASANTPLQFDGNLRQLDLQALIADLNQANPNAVHPALKHFQGQASLNTKLSTWGQFPAERLNNLQGLGEFHIENGILHGIDFGHEVDRALSLLKRKRIHTGESQPKTDAKTRFDLIEGNFRVGDGRLDNPDLRLLTPGLKISGQGHMQLATTRVNYQLSAERRSNSETGLQVPLLVSGPLAKLSIQPDIEQISHMLLKNQFQRKIAPKLDQLGEKIGQTLNRLFQ